MLNNKSILKLILILSITAILGNIFDAATTYFALQKDGLYESIPSMAYVIDNWGWFASLIIKLVFSYIILPVKYCPAYYCLNWIFRNKNEFMRIFLISLLIAVYLGLNLLFWKVSFSNLGFLL